MVVEVLPLDALVWVHYQHAADDVLGDLRDLVDVARESEWFVLDVVDQFDDIGGLVGRASLGIGLTTRRASRRRPLQSTKYLPCCCTACLRAPQAPYSTATPT